MKTLRSAWFLVTILSVLSIACKKDIVKNPADAEVVSSELGGGNPLAPVTLCSKKTVPLCAGQTMNIGTVTVSTASDNNVYITYLVTGNWRLEALHLYAGPDAGIPVNNSGNPVPGQFPYTKTFYAPYIVQQYTFVIPNLPDSFTVAAHAAVVEVMGTQIVNSQTGWGDGCSGTRINEKGNWGTKFTYKKGHCLPGLCSEQSTYFFETSQEPWPDVNGLINGINGINNGNVTVGGYDYTEEEGKEIYNSPDPNGMPDSKNAFIQVATLKLSHTDYTQHSDLLQATITIENWLYTTCGKLSPSNLPTGNPEVEKAANFLHSWIQANNCWHEEE